MAILKLKDGTELYYEEAGKGQPLLMIHGVWMSSRFFYKQIDGLKDKYKVIALDLRGHGQSSKTESGHTVAQYAKDVSEFIHRMDLEAVSLLGWSMGAFVIWEYLHQFGDQRIHSTIIVDELASDFKWDDFKIGAFDLTSLTEMMRQLQTNQGALLQDFIPLMFKEKLKEKEQNWMLGETLKVPASIASAILFDQSIIDCRPYLSAIQVPTLLCFGKEEKLIPVAAGEHLQREIAKSKLELFEQSCHCPFLEEPARFNQVVDDFISSSAI